MILPPVNILALIDYLYDQEKSGGHYRQNRVNTSKFLPLKVTMFEIKVKSSDEDVFFNIDSRVQKPAQSQKNNVRTAFSKRCSKVILLTLSRFLLVSDLSNILCYFDH